MLYLYESNYKENFLGIRKIFVNGDIEILEEMSNDKVKEVMWMI